MTVLSGDHALRRVSDDKREYRIFIKFTNQLRILRVNDYFSLDITIHHERWMKGMKIGRGLEGSIDINTTFSA